MSPGALSPELILDGSATAIREPFWDNLWECVAGTVLLLFTDGGSDDAFVSIWTDLDCSPAAMSRSSPKCPPFWTLLSPGLSSCEKHSAGLSPFKDIWDVSAS